MKKFLKSMVLCLLSAALLCCSLPAAFAADTTYSIGLDAMGGSCSTVVVTTNTSGKLNAVPEDPTLDGYTFDGWYTEPEGGSKVTTSTVFTSDSTVYAHWTVKSTASTAPAAPAQSAGTPSMLNHLGYFVVGGILLGTVILGAAVGAGAASAAS